MQVYSLELDADLVAQPVVVLEAVVGDDPSELLVGETAAGAQDVAVEQICAVLDAGLLLHVGAGRRNGAAVDHRIAAWEGHLVKDEHVLDAEHMRLKR